MTLQVESILNSSSLPTTIMIGLKRVLDGGARQDVPAERRRCSRNGCSRAETWSPALVILLWFPSLGSSTPHRLPPTPSASEWISSSLLPSILHFLFQSLSFCGGKRMMLIGVWLKSYSSASWEEMWFSTAAPRILR